MNQETEIYDYGSYSLHVDQEKIEIVPKEMSTLERDIEIKRLHSISNLWMGIGSAFAVATGTIALMHSEYAYASSVMTGLCSGYSFYKAIDSHLDSKILTKIKKSLNSK